MKTIIAALALATVISAPALAQTRHQVPAYEAYGQSQQFPARSFAAEPRNIPGGVRTMQGRNTDPDPFIRDYLRSNPPGSQWSE